jgi:hypothetical protein
LELKKLILPNSLKYISDNAISGDISEIEFNNNLEYIGKNAIDSMFMKNAIIPRTCNYFSHPRGLEVPDGTSIYDMEDEEQDYYGFNRDASFSWYTEVKFK